MTVTLSRNWRIQPRASISTSAFSVGVSNAWTSSDGDWQRAAQRRVSAWDKRMAQRPSVDAVRRFRGKTSHCKTRRLQAVNAIGARGRPAGPPSGQALRPAGMRTAASLRRCARLPSIILRRDAAIALSTTLAVVLAAGKGTRMKSELPKVLVPVCGRPMIDYVLDALASGRRRPDRASSSAIGPTCVRRDARRPDRTSSLSSRPSSWAPATP